MHSEKVCIYEKKVVGTGDLCRDSEFLGKCDYDLGVRKSLVSIQRAYPNGVTYQKEFLILSIMGKIHTQPNLDGLAHLDGKKKTREILTLHLNEDYLITVTLFPEQPGSEWYKVYGRIVTHPSPYASPFL